MNSTISTTIMRRNNAKAKDIMASVNPLEARRIETRMIVAKMLHDYLTILGMTQYGLAGKMGKQPSEVSKWLSGNHNFTLDTLSDLGYYLNADFLIRREMMQIRCNNEIQISQSGTRTSKLDNIKSCVCVPIGDYEPSKKTEKCLA